MKSIQDEVMSCAALVELVTEYLDDTLPAEQRACFEQHLYFCEGCVTYVDQLRATTRLVRDISPPVPGGPASIERLAAAFRRWKESRGA